MAKVSIEHEGKKITSNRFILTLSRRELYTLLASKDKEVYRIFFFGKEDKTIAETLKIMQGRNSEGLIIIDDPEDDIQGEG